MTARPLLRAIQILVRRSIRVANHLDDQIAYPVLENLDRELTRALRRYGRSGPVTQAGQNCPSHGLLCVGHDCCCNDLHVV